MSLKAIDNVKTEVKELQDELNAKQTETEKLLEEVRGELAELKTSEESRKREFDLMATPSDDFVKHLKEDASKLHLKSVLTGRSPESFKEYKDIAARAEKAIKPTDLSNWLAEEFSGSVMEELELALRVESLFPAIRMPDNRESFSIPSRDTNAEAFLIAPAQDAIESAVTSGKVTFSTSRIKSFITIADQADDETVAAVTNIVRQELVRSLSRASEQAIINGDTALAVGSPNDVRSAFDGLRKYANTNAVDNGGGGITAAKILEARAKMGVYGVNLMDLVLLVNVKVGYQLLGLPEVITVDKYGPNATIHTGEIGSIYGLPIIVSEYVPDNLDAAGNIDEATPGTLTQALLVNTSYYASVSRNQVALEQDRNIVNSTNLYVAWRDYTFGKLTNANIAATSAVGLVNIS
jgi:HK97 family phage major capsid protein